MRRLLLVIVAALLALSVVAAQEQTVHVVQAGENLFRISLRYNVSMDAIAQANGLTNRNLIFIGQQLVIPGVSGSPAPAPTDPPSDGGSDGGTVGTYTVVRGDTLAAIARRFNTTFQAIASANGIANPNRIFVGQVLNIPGAPGGPAPTPPPVVDGGDNVPPPAGPGGFELGGHVFSFAYPDQMRGTGMTWAKLQVVWNQGDPPSVAQGAIDAARSRGFKVLLGIKGRPEQLGANPTQYYQEYANFVGGVAALGADAIEVWNEQNIDREWPAGQINAQSYTQMLSAAYQAIKANNPNTLVISGAPAPTGFFQSCTGAGCNDDEYIRGMAAAGAANFMDCLGIHYNAGTTPPSATSGAPVGSSGHYSWYYPTMVQVYTSAFPGKQLCFTELGYLTGEGLGELPGGFSWASGNTLAEQAQWLGDVVRQARGSGVVRIMIIWNVDNTSFGADPQAGYAIVRPDGTCPACSQIAAAMQ